MARPPAYKVYRGDTPTMHAGNDRQILIEIARKQSKIFGGKYSVRDIGGNMIWEVGGDG